MEFEQLHLQTVDLLSAKCSEWGLPREDSEEEGADVQNDVGTDCVLADALHAALKMAHDKELPVLERTHSAQVVALRGNMHRMRELKEKVDECTETMSKLRGSYDAVTSRTSSLHDACDRAMAQQTALAAGAEQIRANLHYFKQADLIMKKLNNTSKLSVTGQTFTSILASIDECLTFLRQHSEYKESAVYIQKYEQCLSRAMTWIRVGVLADLEASVKDVRDRQSQLSSDYVKGGRQMYADDDTFALLYGVFAARANAVKSALSVAEQRFANVAEFDAMLAECQNAYFQIRQQLLHPIIESTLNELAKTHGESSCALTRTGCSFLLRVCDDEFRLFRQFFNADGKEDPGIVSPAPSRYSVAASHMSASASLPFEEFTDSLCRLLYDMLRPIIVHNPHLETLAELCTILKVEMIEERCQLVAFENSTVDPRAGFVRVMGELVGDVAERIVYRASTYGQSDILGYKPAPGDLAYPDKLQMMKKIEEEKEKERVESEKKEGEEGIEVNPEATPISAVDMHCLWYPTVRRTVMCLAKLFKCLDMAVFQSLARDLLSMCCESLDTAADMITASPRGKQHTRPRHIDAQLFVVKHLLIMREQTAPYRTAAANRADSSMPTRDYTIDFSRLRESANTLITDRSTNAFLEFVFSVSAPIHVQEVVGDSRRVIDVNLRMRCNQLIASVGDLIIVPLNALVERAEDESLKPNFDLSKVAALQPQNVQTICAQTYKQMTSQWPEIRSAFSLYVGVSETEAILLQPIKKRIIDTFTRLSSFVNKVYNEEQRQIAAVPGQQQIYLVLNKA